MQTGFKHEFKQEPSQDEAGIDLETFQFCTWFSFGFENPVLNISRREDAVFCPSKHK